MSQGVCQQAMAAEASRQPLDDQRAERLRHRIVRLLLLFLSVLCLVFAQVIVAFSQWYGWPLQWLDRLYKLSCLIPLFCTLHFVKYIFLALVAVLAAALLFVLASHGSHGSSICDLVIASEKPQQPFTSTAIAAALGLAAGLEIAVLSFVVQRRLPPGSLWALALVAFSISLSLWERSVSGPRLMGLEDWLYVLAFYSIIAGCAFVGSHSIVGVVLTWTAGLAALAISLSRARKTGDENRLWSASGKIALLFLGIASFALSAYQLNSWRYAVIGDEWGFYEHAVRVLRGLVRQPVLTGWGKYGMHPLLSSYIHAASLYIWGANNYGWRISNVLLVSWSALSLYLFLRLVSSERLALLAVGFYAASHYLISFGKIGYNNLQAFWPILTSLALFSLATRRGSVYGMWLSGVVAGIGFYVFAIARFAVPILGALLLIYRFPISRRRWLDWAALGGGVLFVALPILSEPGTSNTLLKQTLLHSLVANTSSSLWQQFRSNFLYAALSFLSSQKHTHFVFGAHLDPLSSSYMIFGLVALLRAGRPARMSRLLLLAYLLGVMILGAITQYDYPPNTRMFMLVPLYAILAAVGCDRFSSALTRATRWQCLGLLWPALSIAVALPLNLYISSDVYITRRALTQECLLVGMMQDMETGTRPWMPIFIVRPSGDRYEFVQYIMAGYSLQNAKLTVLTPDELLRVFRDADCSGEAALFLIPSQIPNKEPLLDAARQACPGNLLSRLFDPSGAYHYEQIIAFVRVSPDIGFQLRLWKPE